MNKVSFYPGCSLLGTSKEYRMSTESICESIGIQLLELPDWSCCGASSAHAVSDELAVLLPAANLAAAEKAGLTLVTSCSACYSRLKIAQKEIREDEEIKNRVLNMFGCTGEKVQASHLVEYIMGNDLIRDRIKETADIGLKGLKVASYYGCLITRPGEATRAVSVENPLIMEELVTMLDGEPVQWAMKTECCGASLSLTKSSIVESLVNKITDYALRSGAEAIVTACPLCQLNLEMRRNKKHDIPVYYFTELIGIAQGSSEVRKWMKYHLVDSAGVLQEKGLI
jgi:heterodisulfide reductase subunit B